LSKLLWFSGIRVLVVDDIEANRMLLKRILTKMGRFQTLNWEVDEAACGEDALQLIKDTEPRCGR
jgi:CheY-like chemotaxis protein